MPSVVLASLLVWLVAVFGGLAAAAWQGLGAWRAFRTTRHAVQANVRETTSRMAVLESWVARAPDRLARIERARTALDRSLAEGQVLVGGLREVAALVEAARSIVPTR